MPDGRGLDPNQHVNVFDGLNNKAAYQQGTGLVLDAIPVIEERFALKRNRMKLVDCLPE